MTPTEDSEPRDPRRRRHPRFTPEKLVRRGPEHFELVGSRPSGEPLSVRLVRVRGLMRFER